jgi:hypothetical protein
VRIYKAFSIGRTVYQISHKENGRLLSAFGHYHYRFSPKRIHLGGHVESVPLLFNCSIPSNQYPVRRLHAGAADGWRLAYAGCDSEDFDNFKDWWAKDYPSLTKFCKHQRIKLAPGVLNEHNVGLWLKNVRSKIQALMREHALRGFGLILG